MDLDARKRKILEAIILDYISTAEPVGSRTISRKYDLGVSPATIRNEMADLEDIGLLEQPHTSAGRIPSDLGYRYYVDYLMGEVSIEDKIKDTIKNGFNSRIKQLEDVVRQTGDMLSDMTNYTSLVLAPTFGQSSLQLIQLMLIEQGRALIVIITDSGRVENRIIDVPESITKEDLEIVSGYMNDRLKGLTMCNWDKSIMHELKSSLVRQRKVLDEAINLLDSILDQKADNKVYLGGALNILNQPEFMDVDKARNLLGLLEKKEILQEVMMGDTHEGINVKIGSENECEGIHNCSLITATYKLNGRVVGTLGVLGPTRMKYSQVVSMVDYLTKVVSKALTNI